MQSKGQVKTPRETSKQGALTPYPTQRGTSQNTKGNQAYKGHPQTIKCRKTSQKIERNQVYKGHLQAVKNIGRNSQVTERN